MEIKRANERCQNCHYWREENPAQNYKELEEIRDGWYKVEDGSCHRFPPTIPVLDECANKAQIFLTHNDAYLYTQYPVTEHTDWCGEWKERDGGPSKVANPM